MKSYGRIFFTIAISLAGTVLFAGQAAALPQVQHILLKINPKNGISHSILDPRLVAINIMNGVTKIKELPIHTADSGMIFRIETHSSRPLAEQLREYETVPFVAYAELDAPVSAFFVPNDTSYGSQWHFGKIGMESAWNYDTTPPLNGGDPGVVVAVIDSGVAYENYTDGPDIYAQGPDFAQTQFVQGYDFVSDDVHANDDNGHGTNVASIIAESTDNTTLGAGIAFHSSIMPLKVLDRTGVGLMSDVASAVDFAVSNGAKVINLSLGSTIASQTLEDAITRAVNAGIVVVGAAGNDGRSSLSYPALYSNVISVSALGRDDVLASYANYGTGLSLSAPGGDDGEYIWQQGYNNLDAQNLPLDYVSFGLVGFQGTSQAAPHVSGVAALLLAKGVPAASVRPLLEATATDLGPAGYDTQYGYGRLDAASAFNTYLNDITPPQTSATVTPPAPDGLNGYYATLPMVTLTATDEAGGSSVAKVNYAWDSDTQTTYTGPLTPPQGSHTLSYASVDVSGNQETAKTLTLLVDSIGPVITISAPGATSNNPLVRISGTAVDATSGIASLTVDNEPVTLSSSGAFAFSKRLPIGRDVLTFQATDAAGATTQATRTVTVTSKARIVIGPGPGGGPQVFVTSNTGTKIVSFIAFASTFRGGVNVAAGDVDANGTDEILVAPGPGGSPRVKIYNRHAKLVGQFLVFTSTFKGGVRLASADVNHDGKSEILVAPESGGATVKIYTNTGKLIRQIRVFPTTFHGGVNVASGDTNGDGVPEIIVGAGPGGGPQVRIFSATGRLLKQFYAFGSSFRGGVRVATGDVNNDGKDEILASAGRGGGPLIRIFRSNGTILRQFYAFPKAQRNGTMISAADVNGDGHTEIIVGSGPTIASSVRIFQATGKLLKEFHPYADAFLGGITIATGFTD